MNSETFAQVVYRLRKECGLGQMDLADAVGVGFTYISKIENGHLYNPPSNDVLENMARVFNVTTEYMFAAAGRIDTRALQDMAMTDTNVAMLLMRLVNATPEQILSMLAILGKEG